MGLCGVAAIALTACGGGSVGSAAPPASAPPYGEVVAALATVKVPICGQVDLPKPAAEAAQSARWFRYRAGRIYEFGPCQLAAGNRNEVRVYRYPDPAARDTALRDQARRGTRPTSTFAVRDVDAVEIWSPGPSLESPVGQAAATVHSAIARIPGARHLDVGDQP